MMLTRFTRGRRWKRGGIRHSPPRCARQGGDVDFGLGRVASCRTTRRLGAMRDESGTEEDRSVRLGSNVPWRVVDVRPHPDVFAQVGIDHGAVTWPGEIDLAPDAMYDEIKASGQWVLE